MTVEPTSLPTLRDLSEESKASRVYHELRRRIRELTLPPGAPLRKEDLAIELGVSRAPVSEAIARLAEEALVDVFPQHGSFVAPIRGGDVRESLFIRTALEVEAIRRVTERADPLLLGQLEANLKEQAAALHTGDLAHFHDLDEALHAAIFAALDCPRALRTLETVRAPLDRPRRLALPEEGRARATYLEHVRLVEAIRSGDAEFAGAAMRVHLSMVTRSIEAALVQIDGKKD